MYLVWYLTIGILFSLILGEFGQFPFASPMSVSLTDFLLGLAVMFLVVWNVAIKKDFGFLKPMFFISPFLGLAILSLFISNQFGGGVYLIRFLLYALSLSLGYSLIKSNVIQLNSLVTVIIRVGIILSILGFIQLLIYPDLEQLALLGYDPHQNRLVSTFLDPNFLGAFLTIPLLFSINRFLLTKKKLQLVSIAILLSAILLTFSRSAYLALLLQISFYSLIRSRKLLVVGIIILILSYFFIPRFSQRIEGGFQIDTSANERIESWQKGISIFQQNPILGVGFNNLKAAYQRYELTKVFSPDGGNSGAGVDSSLIFVLATTGILGFLGYLYFWLAAVRMLIKKGPKKSFLVVPFLAILLGFLVNSQFINSLFFAPILVTLFLFIGALYAVED